MYATSENRVWTAQDEREMKAEHKRVTRATMKHLGKSPADPDRTLMDKLLRRSIPATELPPNKRPLPPKAGADAHWWNRSSGKFNSQEVQPEVRRAVTITGNLRAAPPVPPRYDLLQTSPPDRPRRKSEHDSVTRQRARETALRHLETDRGFGRYVKDNQNYVPPPLKPGTWIPGQLNAVSVNDQPDDYDYDFIDEYGSLTTHVPHEHVSLSHTPPRHIISQKRAEEPRGIPTAPPIPQVTDRSNRESFLELRKKRSYRV